jgi:hypothetical protein
MALEGKDYRPLWFGAIGALLAAAFTFAGNLGLHYFTTKSAALSYSVTQGPSLPTPDGFKEIFVVNARNTGRAEVTNLAVLINANHGKLEQGSWRSSEGVTGQDTLNNNTYQVMAPLLNPGEHVSLATIITIPESGANPDVVVRAVGVTGVREDLPSESKGSNLLSTMASALTALLSFTVLGLVVGRNSWFRNFVVHAAGVVAGPSVTQRESLTYILYACGIGEESEKIRSGERSTTYMEFADRLLLAAKYLPNEQERQPQILALECMLLIPEMLDASRENVKRALRILTGSNQINEDEIKKVENRRLAATNWRDEIDRLVAESVRGRSVEIKASS